MDPICHTLVGLALAGTGLRRTTRYATGVLVVGANLPDIDVVSYAWGELAALEFRRGVTHGVMGLMLLPPVLTLAVFTYHRMRSPAALAACQISWAKILALAYGAILTHPVLDWFNTYGMRWLMPFSDRWSYGDIFFIVDPWVWAILAAGVYLSRSAGRAGRPVRASPAALALAVVAAYALFMAGISDLARRYARAQFARAGWGKPIRVMASPVPVNSLRRWVVLEDSAVYRFGTFDLVPRPRFVPAEYAVDKNETHPLARLAAATAGGRSFLRWARFPFYVVPSSASQPVIYIVDARYAVDPEAEFGTVAIPLGGRPVVPAEQRSP